MVLHEKIQYLIRSFAAIKNIAYNVQVIDR